MRNMKREILIGIPIGKVSSEPLSNISTRTRTSIVIGLSLVSF